MWPIRDRLYLGDYASGVAALAGVRRPLPSGELAPFAGVVSLCPMPLFPEDTIPGPEAEETEWLELPIADGGNGEQEFEAALRIAERFARRRIAAGNVLIHCAAGMSRSVSVVAALLCSEGLAPTQAFVAVANAKAKAAGRRTHDPMSLIEPAAEFRRVLERLYGRKPAR
ncbi:MAG: dual specificity protein phosphatase family protein [Polyangiaceae bacterium]|nr:dual specificity protein phosphatase family protein [Myxococcales bacterium]MCB9588810.1 dual specificity protein phosphatase family protein [Polyangiaceae bacterium]MCB9605369.1 dual specificity protein phosphatase family protein [Polyangiaceae bacterium]